VQGRCRHGSGGGRRRRHHGVLVFRWGQRAAGRGPRGLVALAWRGPDFIDPARHIAVLDGGLRSGGGGQPPQFNVTSAGL
jgi:hypothetical protein